MNTLNELRIWCIQQGNKYPQLKSDINGFYELALMELEDETSSLQGEIDSCVIAIEQMIENL